MLPKASQLIPDRRLRRSILGMLIALAAYTLSGFFLVPALAKWLLVDNLSKGLHRPVSIHHIAFNPYTLIVNVYGLVIKEREGSGVFASLDKLHLDVEWGSIFQWALVINHLKIKSPYVRVVRNADQGFNFSDLLSPEGQEANATPKGSRTQNPQESNPKPPRFVLRNLHLVYGRVEFSDRPYDREHKIADLDLRVPFLSSLDKHRELPAKPLLSLRYNEAPMSVRVETRPFSPGLDTAANAEVQDLMLPPLLVYSPVPLHVQLLSGSLALKSAASFSQGPNAKPMIGLTGEVAVKSLEAQDPAGKSLLKLPALDVSIAGVDPVAQIVHLSKIALKSPEVRVERDASGKINLQGLVSAPPAAQGPKATDQPSASPFVLKVDEIRVADGKLSFFDFMTKDPFQTTVGELEVKVDQFSTERGNKASYALSAHTESNETIKIKGQFCLTPLSAEGALETAAISLKKYAPYYAEQVLFDIEDGQLDLVAQVQFAEAETAPDAKAVLKALSLDSLRLRQREEKEPFLSIGNLSVKDAELDPSKREVRVAEVATRQGSLAAVRLKNGEISLEKLLAPRPANSASQSNAALPPQELPWLVSVGRVLMEECGFKLEDQMPTQRTTLTVDQMKLVVEGISTAKDTKSKLNLSLVLNQKGSVSVEGEISADPLVGDLRVDVKGLEFAPFEPYVPEDVRIKINSGDLSTKGRIILGKSPKGELALKFKGDMASSNFASRDKPTGEDFLKWKAVYVTGIDFTLNPLGVDIGEVALQDSYSRIIIKQDGTLNVQDVMAGQEVGAEATPAASGGASPPVRIGKVLLKNGQINFTDRTIQPNVSANMLEIEGVISELSSDETKLGDVNLTGKLEHQSPLEITGKINPLRKDLFVDLKIRFKDIDLVRMNPYSQKYVGYKIRKGKLFLDLDYLIIEKKLESQNRVLFDQLTLGDKVQSPDAPDLPIKLAISILKNREGQIILELPVTGNIDDPQFDLGKIIWGAIGNLFTKIITAPFSLLADLLGGGGEEASFLEFEPGRADLAKGDEEKIGNLVNALRERPELELELEGQVDLEKDAPELKRAAVLNLMKKQKLAEMEKKKQALPPIQDLQIEPKEREKYLRMAYEAEKNPEAQKDSPSILSRVESMLPFLGKGGPPPLEMEQFLMGRIQVTNEEFRAFALRRASAVKDALLVSGVVEPERLFLAEPEVSEKGEGSRRSGVLLRLK